MEWEWQEINETKWSLSSIVNKTVIGYYMNGDLIWKNNLKSKVDTFFTTTCKFQNMLINIQK